MLIVLAALAAATATAPVLIGQLGRPAFGLLALVPAGAFIWTVRGWIRGDFAPDAPPVGVDVPWMSATHLDITLRMDSLSALFSLIILGIGALILCYCWGYFDSSPKRLSVFGAQMIAFTMVMYGLVTADNLLLMYVFWELTSVLSFLLVGYYGERASSRRAAGQALMVTSLGGLAMLVGIILLGTTSGIWELSALAATGGPVPSAATGTAVVLILAGALSKSAVAPMHFWLPGAMAAPTPVSAYLHSAAMVKAGIYLVARLSPELNQIGAWHLVVIPAGLSTMLMAGWMALRQVDLKLILAYGTVSQLGFIIAVVGIGSPGALLAGLALTVAHALFKAALFMVVGTIDRTTGTRDIRELSGLGRNRPALVALAAAAAASMAGVPGTLGFVAKEATVSTLLDEPLLTGMPGKLLLSGVVAGSTLTVAYSLYFLHGAFATKSRAHATGGGTSPAVAKASPVIGPLWIPPALLAGGGVALGLVPAPVDVVAGAYAGAPAHLSLWHGWTLPLFISGIILSCGVLLHWQRHTVSRLHFSRPALGNAGLAYDAVVDTLRRVSLRITATTQRGSLPLNEAIILSTLVVLPLAMLVTGARTDIRMELWDSPVQGLVVLIVVVAAIAATVTDNRLSVLILVGMTGYGVAVIFALHGAPDLALTQLLVETVTVVVFVLVLRKLPASTENRGPEKDHTRLRAWLAVAVGLTVTVLGAFAMNARTSLPVSIHIPDLASRIGHGSNAVNVLLVDIRAWDTFGEISVLVVVATGVASLVYRTRSFSRVSRRPTLRTEAPGWLAAPVENAKARNRSFMMEVATRILFPSMITLSLYFFFAGHNAPGGGFAGGLVAALAFMLRYLAGGREELEEALPVDASRLLGTGLLLSAGAVVAPMLIGRPPLSSANADIGVPLIGTVHVVSPVVFDAGVYLIVVGLILHILRSLGAQLDIDEEQRRRRARERARRLARRKTVQASGDDNGDGPGRTSGGRATTGRKRG
ncbi:Na+/H+ antiporter subunit A [Corynebacterium pygosceleis]|uniref:Na+/H+ antiporter subunit A n=1 Tax=Corynebacterium pygosceleis TaxID=2800406 RepID=A0A9Q4GM93_9CORY|nr:Na+/H+ antiporter subunit A [Corynebacterium pygosceleis]MCK7638392.1 Na+/H+ antiporter subunit A [Corynebacterium pygosceleis]MCK7675372.1 Na+/H+ antiporter subunit A [Corynebacterium pygosceleis]MCL0121234.1 Na+/H+ antiporter subunit A [Corynebacterium pygosceleis]MCX7469055.1 Na+/H+ antiporter subunit A [Corynebacterium pygosceleis]